MNRKRGRPRKLKRDHRRTLHCMASRELCDALANLATEAETTVPKYIESVLMSECVEEGVL